MARVTICLPVYNGALFVEQALASIASQTIDDYVVIASNNASTDRTGEILARWSEKLPMEVITQPETLVMLDHFSVLLDRVDSEFYMLLCHDDYFYSPDALARGLAVMEQNPDVSAVYADMIYVSEGGRALARRRFSRSGKLRADELGRQSLRLARNMFGIPLLARTAALAANRYDPRFHYTADVDLSWRLSANAPLWRIPEILLANRFWGDNSTWSLRETSYQEFIAIAEKHGVVLSPAQRIAMKFMNRFVGVKKRMFGLYERGVTRWG